VKLDLSSLRKAISQLDQAMAYTDSAQAQANRQLRRVLQIGAIKAFEFTYELSWKMLKRHLERTAAAAQSIDELAFPDLIRAGSEQGLLRSGWDVWKDFRKARNMTSHIYDEDKAAQVFALIPSFREEAVALLERLVQRHT
jgi:nucleotidyltransferase substrate binding protein (TIGR01987 family)